MDMGFDYSKQTTSSALPWSLWGCTWWLTGPFGKSSRWGWHYRHARAANPIRVFVVRNLAWARLRTPVPKYSPHTKLACPTEPSVIPAGQFIQDYLRNTPYQLGVLTYYLLTDGISGAIRGHWTYFLCSISRGLVRYVGCAELLCRSIEELISEGAR